MLLSSVLTVTSHVTNLMLVRDENRLDYERDFCSYVSAETCATNEDKNITPDSFVFLFFFLLCVYPLITNCHTSH